MSEIDLTREAIDRPCQIRLPGCLNKPCCLCHFRVIGMSGLGLKNHDAIGAWGCDSCHKKVDTTQRGNFQTQSDFKDAVIRTIHTLLSEGKLTVKEKD